MVTHNWGNKFCHLIAAILSEAIGRLVNPNERDTGKDKKSWDSALLLRVQAIGFPPFGLLM